MATFGNLVIDINSWHFSSVLVSATFQWFYGVWSCPNFSHTNDAPRGYLTKTTIRQPLHVFFISFYSRKYGVTKQIHITRVAQDLPHSCTIAIPYSCILHALSGKVHIAWLQRKKSDEIKQQPMSSKTKTLNCCTFEPTKSVHILMYQFKSLKSSKKVKYVASRATCNEIIWCNRPPALTDERYTSEG